MAWSTRNEYYSLFVSIIGWSWLGFPCRPFPLRIDFFLFILHYVLNYTTILKTIMFFCFFFFIDIFFHFITLNWVFSIFLLICVALSLNWVLGEITHYDSQNTQMICAKKRLCFSANGFLSYSTKHLMLVTFKCKDNYKHKRMCWHVCTHCCYWIWTYNLTHLYKINL